MICLKTQSSSKSDETQEFSNQTDFEELSTQIMNIQSVKKQEIKDEEIQKVLTAVESKLYLVHDEILALDQGMSELDSKYQRITDCYNDIKYFQEDTKEKLQEAKAKLRKIRDTLKNDIPSETRDIEIILQDLKLVENQIYPKQIEAVNLQLEEPIKKLEDYILEVRGQQYKGLKLNLLNQQLSWDQWQKFNFLQQFENYENFPPIIHKGNIRAAQISPDEKLIVSVGMENVVSLWNIESKQYQGYCQLKEQIHSLCFSQSQQVIYAGCESGNMIQLYYTDNFLGFSYSRIIHKSEISFIMNTKDEILITYSIDGFFKIIDLSWFVNQKQIIHNNHEPRNFDYSQEFDFIIGSQQNKIVIWNQATTKQLMENECYSQNGIIQVYLSQSNKKVLSISDKEPGIRILQVNLDSQTLDLLHTVYSEIKSIYNVSWGLDDETFIFCERKYFHIINIPKWSQKKVILPKTCNRTIFTKQVPSFRFLISFSSNLVQYMQYVDDVLTLDEADLKQLMEESNEIL